MYNWFLSIEFAILDFISSMHFPLADKLMIFITHLGDGGILWILTGVLFLCRKSTRKAGICILVSLVLSLIITNLTLKNIVERIRPFDLKEGMSLLVDAPKDYSFPSGHTSASFSAATSAWLCNRKYGMIMLCPAVLIAFSRLYLYVHFPSDVLCAALIGMLCGHLAVYGYNKISDRLSNM